MPSVLPVCRPVNLQMSLLKQYRKPASPTDPGMDIFSPRGGGNSIFSPRPRPTQHMRKAYPQSAIRRATPKSGKLKKTPKGWSRADNTNRADLGGAPPKPINYAASQEKCLSVDISSTKSANIIQPHAELQLDHTAVNKNSPGHASVVPLQSKLCTHMQHPELPPAPESPPCPCQMCTITRYSDNEECKCSETVSLLYPSSTRLLENCLQSPTKVPSHQQWVALSNANDKSSKHTSSARPSNSGTRLREQLAQRSAVPQQPQQPQLAVPVRHSASIDTAIWDAYWG